MFENDMLECIDAEAIAIGQCNPIFIAFGKVAEYCRNQIKSRNVKIGALMFSVWVIRLPPPRSPRPAQL